MATPPYQPPRQSGLGQLVDSLFIVVLVFLSLLAPVLTAPKAEPPAPAAVATAAQPEPVTTWASLNQTPAQAAQWEKLGLAPKDAKPMIEHRFDYTVDPLWLAITAVVIAGYFVFVLMVSERQYQDVIRERFGDRP
jgi:hypothetical protein